MKNWMCKVTCGLSDRLGSCINCCTAIVLEVLVSEGRLIEHYRSNEIKKEEMKTLLNSNMWLLGWPCLQTIILRDVKCSDINNASWILGSSFLIQVLNSWDGNFEDKVLRKSGNLVVVFLISH